MRFFSPAAGTFPGELRVGLLHVWLLALLTVLMPRSLAAQTDARDSVLQTWRALPADTATVSRMIPEAFKLSFSRPDLALYMAEYALDLAQATGSRQHEGTCRNLIGAIYRQLGAYDIALEYSETALRLNQSIGFERGIGSSYNNIGTLLVEQLLFAEARGYFEKAHTHLKASGSVTDAYWPLVNIAASWYEQDSLDRAEAEFLRLQQTDMYQNDRRFTASIQVNLGSVYLKQKRYTEALNLFSDGLVIKREQMDKPGEMNALNGLAACHVGLRQFDQARIHLDSALTISRSIRYAVGESEACLLYSQLHDAMGNSAEALRWYRRHDAVSDSAMDARQQQKLNQLATAYEIRDKNAQIRELNSNKAALEHALSRQQILLWLLVGVAVVTSLLTVALFINSRARGLDHKRLQVSTRKIQEQQAEIVARNAELESLNQSMDGLLHVVAHDLKAPLNRLAGLASLIETAGPLNEEQQRYMGLISRVNQDAGKLVATLVDLHALEHDQLRLEPETVPLNEVLRSTHESFLKGAEAKHIHLNLHLPAETLVLRTDPAALQRVLDNLVSNALKFTPSGGTVDLRLAHEGARTRISVTDSGPGIRPEERHKLFRKFQRLSAVPTGGEGSSGLGLAISAALVKQLGGTLDVISTPGQGATFFLLF